jgi:hypothetical protein
MSAARGLKWPRRRGLPLAWGLAALLARLDVLASTAASNRPSSCAGGELGFRRRGRSRPESRACGAALRGGQGPESPHARPMFCQLVWAAIRSGSLGARVALQRSTVSSSTVAASPLRPTLT